MTIKKKLPPGISAREHLGKTQYRARVVDRSRRTVTGRGVQANSRWFEKMGDAKSWLEDKQRTLITIGSLKADKRVTVGAACETWLDISKSVGVNGRSPIEDATWQRYDSTYRTVIVGSINLLRISELRPAMIHKWVQGLAKDIGSDAAHRALGLIKMVLDYQVVVVESIPSNPAKSVNIAKRSAKDGEDDDTRVIKEFMSKSDVSALLKTADALADGSAPFPVKKGLGDYQRSQRTNAWARWRPLTYLLIGSGIRIGEASAIQWKNVDLDCGVIKIECARKRNGTIGQPKSRAGHRHIPIGKQVTEMLRVLKGLAERNPDDCVFGSGGTPLDPSHYADKAWTPMMAIARLVDGDTNRWSRHDCRHYHASVLIRSGVDPQLVAERLGHADVTITLKVYAHLFKELKGHGNRAGADLEHIILGRSVELSPEDLV